MDSIDGLLYGLSLALSYQNLLAALAGAFVGTAIGVLPGLGPTAGIALILPITYSLDPSTGLIMMSSMLYGAMYGGSTASILVNIPGESSAVVACIDGYKLTKKGRAGATLCITAVASFVAGIVSIFGVALFAPPLAELGLMFGPAELFALTAGGLLLLARISGGTFAAGVFPMTIGLLIGTIGQESVTGMYRFTFGTSYLIQGFTLAAVVIGLYGISEMLNVVASLNSRPKPIGVKLSEMLPSRKEWQRSWAPIGRGTVLGFIFGLLPGPSSTLSTFASYKLEKSISKYKDEIGEGAIEGVAGPEAANNSAATSLMVPLLALGIPFNSAMALMLAALMVHGVQPGPMLMVSNPDVFWAVIASMFIGNVMLLVLNVPAITLWVSLLRIPTYIFLPLVLLLSVVGAYSMRNSMFDVYSVLAFGIVGYGLTKLEFELAPMVVGTVLGPMIEKHLREALFLSQGDAFVFVGSPIAVAIWCLVVLVFSFGAQKTVFNKLIGRYRGTAL